MRLTARVPATSANLGPGFDSFGLALDLCNEVTIDTDAEPGVSWEGEGAQELPTDASDMVSRAMAIVAREAGVELPRFRLHGVNRIPLERGLGSSAAAAVAGIALGGVLGERRLDPETTLVLAAGLEGHPDNVAAAIYGGLTIAYDGRAVRLDPDPRLRPVALVPDGLRLPTSLAREALSRQVALSDAAFNAARSALAVVALTGRPELLGEALEDLLHQGVRLALVPEVREVFERLRDAGIPVCLSGAGPSLLAFESDSLPVPDPVEGWRALRLPVRATGVEIARA